MSIKIHLKIFIFALILLIASIFVVLTTNNRNIVEASQYTNNNNKSLSEKKLLKTIEVNISGYSEKNILKLYKSESSGVNLYSIEIYDLKNNLTYNEEVSLKEYEDLEFSYFDKAGENVLLIKNNSEILRVGFLHKDHKTYKIFWKN